MTISTPWEIHYSINSRPQLVMSEQLQNLVFDLLLMRIDELVQRAPLPDIVALKKVLNTSWSTPLSIQLATIMCTVRL